MFFLLVPTAESLILSVENDECAEFETRRHLLMKVYTFSAPMNMICDMTNSLVANPGPKFSIDKCDVGSYFEVEDILCPAVNLFYLLSCIFCNLQKLSIGKR